MVERGTRASRSQCGKGQSQARSFGAYHRSSSVRRWKRARATSAQGKHAFVMGLPGAHFRIARNSRGFRTARTIDLGNAVAPGGVTALDGRSCAAFDAFRLENYPRLCASRRLAMVEVRALPSGPDHFSEKCRPVQSARITRRTGAPAAGRACTSPRAFGGTGCRLPALTASAGARREQIEQTPCQTRHRPRPRGGGGACRGAGPFACLVDEFDANPRSSEPKCPQRSSRHTCDGSPYHTPSRTGHPRTSVCSASRCCRPIRVR